VPGRGACRRKPGGVAFENGRAQCAEPGALGDRELTGVRGGAGPCGGAGGAGGEVGDEGVHQVKARLDVVLLARGEHGHGDGPGEGHGHCRSSGSNWNATSLSSGPGR
jgi:hypothetical protein